MLSGILEDGFFLEGVVGHSVQDQMALRPVLLFHSAMKHIAAHLASSRVIFRRSGRA